MNGKEFEELFKKFEDEIHEWARKVANMHELLEGSEPEEDQVWEYAARTMPKLPR